MINITEESIEVLKEMSREAFINNAKVDNIKNKLATRFSCNIASEKIHYGIAHYFSGEDGADGIDTLLEGHNIAISFGGIPLENLEYNNLKDVFQDLLDICYDYQNKLNKCINIIFNNYDTHLMTDLLSFAKSFNKIVEQCILLVDKINLYGENPTFDADIEKFWILD